MPAADADAVGDGETVPEEVRAAEREAMPDAVAKGLLEARALADADALAVPHADAAATEALGEPTLEALPVAAGPPGGDEEGVTVVVSDGAGEEDGGNADSSGEAEADGAIVTFARPPPAPPLPAEPSRPAAAAAEAALARSWSATVRAVPTGTATATIRATATIDATTATRGLIRLVCNGALVGETDEVPRTWSGTCLPVGTFEFLRSMGFTVVADAASRSEVGVGLKTFSCFATRDARPERIWVGAAGF